MRAVPAVEHLLGVEVQAQAADEMIAALAARQHGVVSRRSLLAEGVTRRGIERRLERGWLIPLHRGVHAVGHRRLRTEGFFMAAVLASGDGAVLSHRSAAAHLNLLRSSQGRLEVTIPRDGRSRPGIQIHSLPLEAADHEPHEGIPTTTVHRTILDLAAVLPPHRVERAIEQATLQRRYDPSVLRIPTATGAPEVDCLWRTRKLIVELDSRAFHLTPQAFERDHARDRALAAEGFTVLRVTSRALADDQKALAAQLASLVA